MEKQQEQKIQISGWRDLTLEQLALLMRDYAVDEQGQLRAEWEKLQRSILEYSGQTRMDYTRWVAVYFLLLVAVRHYVRIISPQKCIVWQDKDVIAKKYHLHDILALTDEAGAHSLFFQLGCFFRGSTEEVCKKACSELVKDHNKILKSSNEKVGEVFDRVIQRHLNEFEDAGNRKITYNRFLYCLDGLNEDCARMWVEYEEYEERLLKERLLEKIRSNRFAAEAEGKLENGVKQIIFTGAPGTGKTYAAKLIAAHRGTRLPAAEEVEESAYYRLVQFHPSYD